MHYEWSFGGMVCKENLCLTSITTQKKRWFGEKMWKLCLPKGKERKGEGGVQWLEKFLSKHLFSQWTNIFLPPDAHSIFDKWNRTKINSFFSWKMFILHQCSSVLQKKRVKRMSVHVLHYQCSAWTVFLHRGTLHYQCTSWTYCITVHAYDCILHLKGCTSVDLHIVNNTRHLHRSYKINSHLWIDTKYWMNSSALKLKWTKCFASQLWEKIVECNDVLNMLR